MEKPWAAVSHHGMVLAELLRERSAPPALPVPLGFQGVSSADWQQDDMLSISTYELGEQELAFLSEDVESAEHPLRLPLIKRASAVLQQPWPTQVHPDFLFKIQSSWGHPATVPAVSRSMDTLYRVHNVEKLGLAQFLPVEA
ncbi:UNVERIFIED_CONTAM: hypothetical protein FKN15_040294 [Acipenser sinensis]